MIDAVLKETQATEGRAAGVGFKSGTGREGGVVVRVAGCWGAVLSAAWRAAAAP